MKLRKLFILLLISALVLSVLCGCSKSANGAPEYAPNDSYYDADMGTADSVTTGSSSLPLPENRKLIRTVHMEAESEDLDAFLSLLETQLSALNGYIESREFYTNSNSASRWRNAYLTMRIPSDQADVFLTQMEESSNVTSLNETLDDVTLDYVATESRILALETEHERLLELMEQAETLTDLLEIEARLTDVRYELETVTSQLRLYDNLIDYTTIHLHIRQVTELTPTQEQTVWQRIGSGFVDTLQDLGAALTDIFVWFVVTSPVLILIAIPIAALILLIRVRRKRKKAARSSVQGETQE